ncbi:MAG: aspartate carbamoyltransferase catalytic subunit [Candidatus Cloacimonetes bacterium]|nr:aspartate carbamoyltransferase catalytic subunit [Candidatus Cloacimonadota bacterium]
MAKNVNLVGRNLYDLDTYSSAEIETIFETTQVMKSIIKRDYKKIPTLRGKTVCTLFFEDSTRTRISFELAAKRLSADVISFTKAGSSLKKGESLQDTVYTLDAMGVDLYVIRHGCPGTPALVHKYSDKPVLNAGDGKHAHPTQALLDMFSIWEKKGTLDGLKITIVGDILHSRVARSNCIGMKKMGAEVTVCAPRTLMPPKIEKVYGVKAEYDLYKAVQEADAVMALRIQMERQSEGLFPSLGEYSQKYGLNKNVLEQTKDDVLIMHPGPMNRGIEIFPEVADSEHSVIIEQVTNGLAVRMALLFLILGGKAAKEVK